MSETTIQVRLRGSEVAVDERRRLQASVDALATRAAALSRERQRLYELYACGGASDSIYDIECFEESRFTVLVMKSLGARFIVAATHLVDRMSASDSELRLIDIRQMMGVVHGYEKVFSIDKTVIMGDFNANPYDKELLLPSAFNAMLFKDLLKMRASRTWGGKSYPFMYNPTIHWLSENTKTYGSHYHLSGDGTGPIWNCYDQALVSPALMDSARCYSYLKKIGGVDLFAEIRPRREISDHLPLLVEIDMGQVDDGFRR